MPMVYAAFFPKFSSCDAWVSSFRSQHDAKASLVEPHLTLVFPTSNFSEGDLLQEFRKLSVGLEPFNMVFKTAMIMPEAGDSNEGHIFLVPDEGFGAAIRLHDKLYSGILNSELRLDIPFVPHITIGSELELRKAKGFVDELNKREFHIEFEVDHFEIVQIEEASADRRKIALINFKNG